MELKQINVDIYQYPKEIEYILHGCNIYDSSSSPDAQVIFANKDNGYFIKKANKTSLEKEFLMTEYYYKLGLTCKYVNYISNDYDYLITEKIKGNDCITPNIYKIPRNYAISLQKSLLICTKLSLKTALSLITQKIIYN